MYLFPPSIAHRRIISSLFSICATEAEALNANLIEDLSPELSCTLMWFLKKFCLSYLLPNERMYAELSLALSSSFGRDSEGGQWTLNYLLECVERNLRLRTSEPALVDDTISLLITMVDSKVRGELMVKSKSLLDVVRLQQSGHLASVSSNASRGLMHGLVLMAGGVGSDAAAREEVWKHILDPIIMSFKTLLDTPDFNKNYQMDNYRKQVMITTVNR